MPPPPTDNGGADVAGKLRVVFLHLDLGIGGAEQLVVNAAVSALQRGHEVAIYTTHHDTGHCFAETKGDGLLAGAVHAHCDWLPRQLAGRATALCAAVRMVALAAVALARERAAAHVWVVDGVSAPVPLLRAAGLPVVFYCHFPDKLLCVERGGALKRLYRAPLDKLEEWTTGAATTIAVNSRFTRAVFAEAFPGLSWYKPAVLYPPIDLAGFQPRRSATGAAAAVAAAAAAGANGGSGGGGGGGGGAAATRGPLVSINRFERKKNVMLAVEALAVVRERCEEQLFAGVKLVIAGGYDARVRENVEYKAELEARVAELGLGEHVDFRPNITDAQRAQLLREAACVLYTPDREHFGIVPIEAMYAGAPVIAVASGGPLETVLDGETGFLCEQTPDDFARAMLKVLEEPSLTLTMGAQGRAHVAKKFSLQAFGASFEQLLRSALEAHANSDGIGLAVLQVVAMLIILGACGYALVLLRKDGSDEL